MKLCDNKRNVPIVYINSLQCSGKNNAVCEYPEATRSSINTTHNSVNCDRPGECSPEKDCLR